MCVSPYFGLCIYTLHVGRAGLTSHLFGSHFFTSTLNTSRKSLTVGLPVSSRITHCMNIRVLGPRPQAGSGGRLELHSDTDVTCPAVNVIEQSHSPNLVAVSELKGFPIRRSACQLRCRTVSASLPAPSAPPVGSDGGVWAHPSTRSRWKHKQGGMRSEPGRRTFPMFCCYNKHFKITCLTELSRGRWICPAGSATRWRHLSTARPPAGLGSVIVKI